MLTHSFSAAVLASAWIVVSGQAAVPAHVVMLPNGQSSKVTDLGSVKWAGSDGRDEPVINRCHATHRDGRACRSWIHLPTGTELDGRLGWRGYCHPCVATFASECLRRYKRLPVLGREFYCPYCRTMRRDPEDRCRMEADGRRRVKCWPCRRLDEARKESRRVRRRAEIRIVMR